MPIAFSCPGCAKRYEVSDALAGKSGRCKQCGSEFQIPVPRSLAPRPAPPPAAPPSRPSPPPPPRPAPQPMPQMEVAGGLDEFGDDEILDDTPPRSTPRPSREEEPYDELDEADDDDLPPPRRLTPKKAKKRSGGGFPTEMPLPTMILGGGGTLLVLFLAFVVWPSMQGGGGGAGAAPVAIPAGGGPGGLPAEYPKLPPPMGNLYPAGQAPQPVGDLSQHEAVLRDLSGILGRIGDALATIHDNASSKTAAQQIQLLEPQVQQIMARGKSLRALKPHESAELARRTLPEQTAALERLRGERSRIAALPGAGAYAAKLGTLFQGFELALSKMRDEAKAGPQPYVEVHVANVPDGPTSNLFSEKLKARADATPAFSVAIQVGRLGAASYRVWPVANPQAFAGRIDFGAATVSGHTITVQARPADAAELAAMQAAAQEPAESSPAPTRPDPPIAAHPEADPTAPPDADEVTKALFLLKASGWPKQKEGLEKLSRMLPVDERRDEVVAAVEPFAVGSDHTTNTEAVKALANWINPRGEEVLSHLIETSDDTWVRGEAIKQAGRLKLASAAQALASRLEDDWATAPDALRAIGPAAEESVIPLLRSAEARVRRAACEILRDIGGQATLDTMKKLPADPDTFVRGAANDAMRAISGRLRAVLREQNLKLPGKPR